MTQSDPNLSPTKRALLALTDLQAKLDAIEQAQHEPIAIIGMGCRFPGGAETPEAFWSLLQQKTDAITEVPGDRWSIQRYHHPDPDHPGTMVSRCGGFVPHLYDFDAPFFRLSPREAMPLDPQQRLMLELGWEALEHAGISPDSLTGQPVGTFIGLSSIDYWQRVLAQHSDALDAYPTTGNTHSVAAGRLSFLLGITGPSLAIDAACASALAVVHLACQSLRQRECDMALVGAVNRILTPEASIIFSKSRMLSADGRCRTFDASANGFGRAEGGGMVVLKRLRDAESAGDRIHAVILGSAVSHNGRTSGLTVPNGIAQQAVIRQALKASRITPSEVTYVETHGTGTALGDPIEVGALGAVFGDRPADSNSPLILGAVKTNIGHLEAAAGMAGLIKTVLALQADHIPANLHLNTPNPHIDWANLSVVTPTDAISWPTHETPRTAGVSAFGFNGTNAHIILRESPSSSSSTVDHGLDSDTQCSKNDATSLSPEQPASAIYLLPLSARTPTALNQLVARYARHLSTHAILNLRDICYTASVGRSHFSHRLAILATSTQQLRQILVDVLAGRSHKTCWRSDGLSHDLDTNASTMEQIAHRYVQGEAIDWQTMYQANCETNDSKTGNLSRIVLPTYPFQRQYYGID